jgi:predicted alpha/beta superfamily hydrolase
MPENTEQQKSAAAEQFGTNQNSSVTGDLRLHELRSRVFHNMRLLRVWLPPGYDDPGNERLYPVLYLNDGQNLFDRTTAYTGIEWQADETADRLIREQKIPPMIIVGIDNAQKDRMKEYLPYRSFSPPVLRPQGKKYPDFLLREVMPFVQNHYRAAKGPEHTGLGGSSLGASISLYTAMAVPGFFGRLLLESPSLSISNRQLFRDSLRFRDWPDRVFLAIGTKETRRKDKDQEVVDDVRAFSKILRHAGLSDRRLLLKIDEGAIHDESAWASRLPEALTFLFGR